MSKMHFETVYGLCHTMVRSDKTKSGYAPGIDHLGRDFSTCLRLEGFAALLQGGYADRMLLIGGKTDGLHSAMASAEYMHSDLGVDCDGLDAFPEDCKTTEESVTRLARFSSNLVLSTNFWHIPRVGMIMNMSRMRFVPTEASILARYRGSIPADLMHENYRGRPELMELQGIADMLNGTYGK